MAPDRSAPPAEAPFHPALAIAALVAGTMAMIATSVAAARVGLPLRLQIALATLSLVVPAAALLAASPRRLGSVLGRGIPGARLGGKAVLLGAALWVGSVGLMQLQSVLFPPSPEYLDMFRRIHQALAPANPLDALLSLLVVAALPAVCEELLMRGVLLSSLARPLGPTPAVVVSALLFAAIHLDLYRLLFTLTIGLALGFVRLWTGSIWPPVLAHLTLNGITFAIAPLVDDPSQPQAAEPLLGTLALLLGAAMALPLLRRLRRADASAAP